MALPERHVKFRRITHKQDDRKMLSTRWRPLGDVWSEMNRLQGEMNRLFGRYGVGRAVHASSSSARPLPSSARRASWRYHHTKVVCTGSVGAPSNQ